MSRGGARVAVTLVTARLGKKITAEQQIDVESREMKRGYALSSHGAFDGAEDGKVSDNKEKPPGTRPGEELSHREPRR